MSQEDINKKIIIAHFLGMEGGTKRHVWGSYDLYLAKDCVYENSGLATFRSKQEVMDFFFPDPDSSEGIVKLKAVFHHLEAVGNTVFTERTDHHYDKDGNDVLSPRISGVFELKGGKIKRWADYFDPRPMLELFGDQVSQAAE